MFIVGIVSILAAIAAPNVEVVDEAVETEEVVSSEDENCEEIVFEGEESDFENGDLVEEELVVFDDEE